MERKRDISRVWVLGPKNKERQGRKEGMKFYYAAIFLLLSSIMSSSVYAKENNPTEMADSFLHLIQDGRINEAYDELFIGSSIPTSKPQAVQMLKTQTSSGLPLYGKIVGFEKILEESFGNSTVRLIYILKSELAPTVWEFYFYKPFGSWFLASIKFNDQFQFLDSMK